MVVDYKATGDSFIAGKPHRWSDQQLHDVNGILNYDLAPDGQRFAVFLNMNAPAEEKEIVGTGINRARVLRHLRALLAALDRRVPHVDRVGEDQIARDAAALRAKAMKRISERERKHRRPICH
jgi:hypothetical protein